MFLGFADLLLGCVFFSLFFFFFFFFFSLLVGISDRMGGFVSRTLV